MRCGRSSDLLCALEKADTRYIINCAVRRWQVEERYLELVSLIKEQAPGTFAIRVWSTSYPRDFAVCVHRGKVFTVWVSSAPFSLVKDRKLVKEFAEFGVYYAPFSWFHVRGLHGTVQRWRKFLLEKFGLKDITRCERIGRTWVAIAGRVYSSLIYVRVDRDLILKVPCLFCEDIVEVVALHLGVTSEKAQAYFETGKWPEEVIAQALAELI